MPCRRFALVTPRFRGGWLRRCLLAAQNLVAGVNMPHNVHGEWRLRSRLSAILADEKAHKEVNATKRFAGSVTHVIATADCVEHLVLASCVAEVLWQVACQRRRIGDTMLHGVSECHQCCAGAGAVWRNTCPLPISKVPRQCSPIRGVGAWALVY